MSGMLVEETLLEQVHQTRVESLLRVIKEEALNSHVTFSRKKDDRNRKILS